MPCMDGRYAIVTGASRGIGAAIAARLAADGCDVVINYRSNSEAAERVAEQVRAVGREASLVQVDVTDRAAVSASLQEVVSARGAPWAVVVNAGITRDGLLMWMKEDDWDEVIGLGLGGFYNVVKPVIAEMLKARCGRVVTIASVTGQMGNAGQVNYAAAKGGLIAATKSLAREIAKRGITANVVAPGLVDTELTADLPLDRLLPGIPLGRVGTVDEVAAAVSYLCSDAAGYVTGQVLGVNGGLYM